MLVTDPDQATVHAMHGSIFASHVCPARGSEQLCAWTLRIPASTSGTAHRVTHEEVLFVLEGSLHAEVDGTALQVVAGASLRVPAGATLRASTEVSPVLAWVVSSVGLQAITDDGTRISPPWTR